jgi:hypothetical protein
LKFSDVLFAAASRDNLQNQNQQLDQELDVHRVLHDVTGGDNKSPM